MRRPQLASRLVLEAPRRISDGGGGFEVLWEVLGTLWAEISATGARESVAGLSETARVTHRVTIRNAPVGSARRPVADQRFRQGARLFAIRGVAEADPKGGFLTCWVEEGPFT